MNNLNRGWILTCFGTAVGAGILFLPISAGFSGICPILFLTLIIFPITYISHRGITRIVTSCPKETDIVGAIEYDLGHTAGFIVSILYFLSIVTICVGYATALTNMLDALLTNHFHMYLSRPFLTFFILIIMTSVMFCNEKTMIIVTSLLTFPLIIMLLAISLYMIPEWNLSAFYEMSFNLKIFIKNTLLLLPILIFAMNFSPVCSSLGYFYKKKFISIEDAIKNSDHVVKWTSILLFVFVMFFVISLFFSITPKILLNAKEKNIDALTAIAIAYNTPIFLYTLPIIAFLAISSSYFGHFAGAREGISGIIKQLITWNNPEVKEKINIKKIKIICTIILVALLWIFAVYNLSVLSIIGTISSPIIAIYAYLMPVMFMKKVPRLRMYQSKWAAFVFVIGIIIIAGYCLGQFV
ncbi:MAG: amino acid permease [Endomicrobium sp.]|nr:amino acid permease [Endomicrobium sp.]